AVARSIVIGGDLTINNCNGAGVVFPMGGRFNPPQTPLVVVIGGNVKASNNPSTGWDFEWVAVGGKFEWNENLVCKLQWDVVSNDVTVNNNNGIGVAASVSNSAIGGDLKCNGNTSVGGSGNIVAGNKNGQCSGL